jgi:hypothetical protein
VCFCVVVMPRGDSYQLQGQQGGVVLEAGDLSSGGPYRWVQVISDTVFGTFESNITDSDTKLVGVTVPAGIGIGGNITSVEVTSGVVIAYTS